MHFVICSNAWGFQSLLMFTTKAEGIIFLIHLFARAILLMKKLKIEETKVT